MAMPVQISTRQAKHASFPQQHSGVRGKAIIILSSQRFTAEMNYLSMALKFLVGGSIIVGVTLLAQEIDPKYGGILAAAPITTTLAFLFTYSETNAAITQQLVLSTFYFIIPTVLFLLALYFLINRFSILPSLGGAFGVWIAALLAVNYAIS